jgi:SWI/SNF-related matrix-associated actin-dependent regulator 1 of chromatin subfamily A
VKLLPFQQQCVDSALKMLPHGGVFIADQMGLGKTIEALAIVLQQRKFPVLIVTPASLKLNWVREIEQWIPNVDLQVLSGTTPRISTQWPTITIINYDILESWASVMPLPATIILDESHYIKNGAASRSKAAIRLSDRMALEATRICLSGTPIINSPNELITQLRFLHRIEELGGISSFRSRYGTGEHLQELNSRMRSSFFIRRKKEDVLQELPDKRWSRVILTGDPTVMGKYRKAEQDIIAYLAEQSRLNGKESDVPISAQQLLKITHLRRLATEAKFQQAVEWIRAFPSHETKLVIFAHHRMFVSRLSELFSNGCRIAGDQTIEERQAAVDKFQRDDQQRIIVCSLKAAGVGHTLTAASDVVFIEQGWTSADMDQASDRCHRIGQHDSVTAWNLLCAETIDERVDALISKKRRLVEATADGLAAHSSQSILTDLVQEYAGTGIQRG